MKLFLLLVLMNSANLFAEVGSVTGNIPVSKVKDKSVPVGKYRGKISGDLASPPPVVAAVWLENKRTTAPASPKDVSLPQSNYQFGKHILVIPKGTTVLFPNNDPDYHNVYSLSKTKRFDIGRYKKGETPIPKVKFDKTGFIALRCEIHDHMKANIVVVDSPYYTTTDLTGNFSMKNVPAGEYTLHAQVDKKTTWKATIEVKGGRALQIKFDK